MIWKPSLDEVARWGFSTGAWLADWSALIGEAGSCAHGRIEVGRSTETWGCEACGQPWAVVEVGVT